MVDSWKDFVSSSPQGPKVLVIDGDERGLNATTNGLALRGYNAIPILEGSPDLTSLDQLNSIIQEASPAALITDFTMGGFDGNEVCRHVKKSFPELPVLLYSGNRDDVKAAIGNGFDGAALKGIRGTDDLTQTLASKGINAISRIPPRS